MLEIKKLRKEYMEQGGNIVPASYVDHMVIESGKMYAIKGVSGSGKSTLLNMISGILAPTSGEILFCGKRIDNMPENLRDEWRSKNIGYIFQNINLIDSLSAVENVELPSIFANRGKTSSLREKSIKLLDNVGLIHKINSKPSDLSAGERQRVAIARALINSPQIILADEPTASLDKNNSKKVIEIIMSHNKSNPCSVLVASHDEEVLSMFTKVFVLERP